MGDILGMPGHGRVRYTQGDAASGYQYYSNLFIITAVMLMFHCTAVRVLRNDMSECATGELGNIVVKYVANSCVALEIF